jgi:hypothetical protein
MFSCMANGQPTLKVSVPAPATVAAMLQTRLDAGPRLDGPLLPHTLGGFPIPRGLRLSLHRIDGAVWQRLN